MPENTISLNTATSQAEQTLVVPQASWSKYLTLKAEGAAIEKQVKALEESFGFPTADNVATENKLNPYDSLSLRVVNGNMDTIGKFSVFYYPGAVIKAGWRKRVS